MLAVCAKWEVNATAIGVVTDTRRLRVLVGDERRRRPAGHRAGRRVPGLRPRARRADVAALRRAAARCSTTAADPRETLLALLGSANLASRRPVFEQYDCIVGSRTARRPEQADAAVLMLDADGSERRPALAVSIDGNGRRVAVDPYRGAVEAVLECSANLACVGAEPLGLTNCLNFGNPEKPHIAWQLTRAVAGLADACRALGVPVVGGNVSLYNEGGGGPIYPTPVVGMVGELPDAARAGRLGFAQRRRRVALIAARGWAPSLDRLRAGEAARRAARGRAARRRPRRAARRCTPRSARASARARCAPRTTSPRAALAVALAECCVAGGLGAEVTVDSAEAALFGEGPGAFVVSGPHDAFAAFGAAATVIGVVGGDELRIWDALSVPVDELAARARRRAGGAAPLARRDQRLVGHERGADRRDACERRQCRQLGRERQHDEAGGGSEEALRVERFEAAPPERDARREEERRPGEERGRGHELERLVDVAERLLHAQREQHDPGDGRQVQEAERIARSAPPT